MIQLPGEEEFLLPPLVVRRNDTSATSIDEWTGGLAREALGRCRVEPLRPVPLIWNSPPLHKRSVIRFSGRVRAAPQPGRQMGAPPNTSRVP